MVHDSEEKTIPLFAGIGNFKFTNLIVEVNDSGFQSFETVCCPRGILLDLIPRMTQ